MKRIREIIEHHHIRGLSQAQTSLATSVSRGTVQNYLLRLANSGLAPSEALALSDVELERRLFPAFVGPLPEVANIPDWGLVVSELSRKGVTRRLLWEEHAKKYPGSIQYSRFCALLESHLKEAKLVMRQEHKAGESVFTDYSGDRPSWIDRQTGEIHECELFVMCWGLSCYTYVEAHQSQKSGFWIAAHARAYTFYGCCPRCEVIDNLKSGVVKANRYDPDTNPAYADMSHHYNVAVLPARARKPTDKAKVENAVLQAQRWILARIRNEEFYSLDELNAALRKHLDELNAKPMQGYGGKSRKELFEELDRLAAQALPVEPWKQREWVRCRAGIDYCVQVEKRCYSVPYVYAGRELMAVLSERIVEIFCGDERIAIHERIAKPYGYSIQDAHRPEKHRNVYSWTPERIRCWAAKTGPCTAEYIQALFASRHIEEEAYRPALGILRYAEKHSPEIVEKASRIALSRRMFRTGQFKDILNSPLLHRITEEPPPPPVEHENIRGLTRYAEQMEASL
jgi:transposase